MTDGNGLWFSGGVGKWGLRWDLGSAGKDGVGGGWIDG